MNDKPTTHPACPAWCTTDHDEPITRADGTPVMRPNGRPLTWTCHDGAREQTPTGTFVSLGQMPGGEVEVDVTTLTAGTVSLSVEQARTLAGVVRAEGAAALADAIARTLARLDGEQDGAAR